MDENQMDDKNWKKLMGAVFPEKQPPFPEAFVTKVMARIEEQPRHRSFLNFSWRVPALVLGALAAALTLVIHPLGGNISTESLLLGDMEENISQLAFQAETRQSDDLLAFALEDK